MVVHQQVQPPERQSRKHRVALRPAARIQQHCRRQHTGKHTHDRRAGFCAPLCRQIQNSQCRQRLTDQIKQLERNHLRKALQSGNQSHHDQITARPCLVLPSHRRQQIVIPHIREHRLQHLAHSSRTNVQQRQMRRNSEHRQQRGAQQHHHRLVIQLAPCAPRQKGCTERTRQRDDRRALHRRAQLDRRQQKHKRQHRAERKPLLSGKPRFHGIAKRVFHPLLIHHAFTSVRQAFSLSSCRLFQSAAAVRATAAP